MSIWKWIARSIQLGPEPSIEVEVAQKGEEVIGGWGGENTDDTVQSLICVQLFVTTWTAACQASLFITNSRSWLKLTSIKSVMPSNHLILCHPLLPLPSIFPSIRVFSKESVLCIGWPKYWSFRFSISPSNEYSGLISLRVHAGLIPGWISLQSKGLSSLLQYHSSKASVLQRLAFFIVQLTSIHDHWKNHSLDWTAK